MRIPSDYPGRLLPLALCLSMALFVTTAALVAVVPLADATHDEERTTNGFKAYTPGGEIPYPGETYDVQLYMVPAFMEEEGPIPSDVEVQAKSKVYYTTTLSQCDASNVRTLGMDHGNNLTGTQNDRGMIQSIKNSGNAERSPSDDPGQMTTNESHDHRQISYLTFFSEDELGGPPLRFHVDGVEEESIIESVDCVEMPDAVGWHRTYAKLNGTIQQFHGDRDSVEINGEQKQEGDEFEIWEPTPWYPICYCDESRQVGMRLDPPPGPMTPGSEGGVYHPNGTIEAPYASVNEDGYLVYDDFEVPPENVTSEGIHFHDGFLELTGPIYYAEGHVEEDGTIVTPGGEEIEPDPDEAPERTPTETPGSSDDDGSEDGQETETAGGDDDGAGDDGSDDGSGDDRSGDGGAGDDGSGDGGAGDDDTSGDGDDGPDTPAADGPGFGAIAALLALLISVVAMRRRD